MKELEHRRAAYWGGRGRGIDARRLPGGIGARHPLGAAAH